MNRPKFAIALFAVFFLFVPLFVHAAAYGADKTYEDQLAAARRFADEKSWALARDAYGAALKRAPDDEARRWCELWLARAEWRALDDSSRWKKRGDLERRINALLLLYKKTAENLKKGAVRDRDQLWAEAAVLYTEINSGNYPGEDAWKLWREVLLHWMEQPPSSETGAQLMRFLHEVRYDYAHRHQDGAEKFGDLLAEVSRKAMLPAGERAWCALHATWLQTRASAWSRKARVAGLWQEAAQICAGTRYEAIADACLLVAQAETEEADALARSMILNKDLWRGGFDAVIKHARMLKAKLADAPEIYPKKYANEMLHKLLAVWSEPTLAIDVNPTIRPGSALEFAVRATLCRDFKADLYAFTAEGLEAWGKTVEKNRSPLHIGNAPACENFLRVSGASPVHSMELFEDVKADIFSFRSDVFQFPALDKGFYLLVVRSRDESGNARVAASHIVVSEVRIVALAPTQGDLQLYVLNREDDAPMAGVPVSLAWLARNGAAIRNWTGTTDAEGRASLPMAKENELVGFANGQPVLAHVSRPYRRHEEKLMADLFFDRPLYRPGETVHWKLVAREREEGRFAACARDAVLSVKIDDEIVADRAQVKFNAFGTAHGKFVIPVTTRPGEASCEITMGGNIKEQLSGAFLVDNFVPAALRTTVELASGTESASPGEEVAIRLKAEYFSGGPAAGVSAACKLIVSPAWSGELKDEAVAKKMTEWARELAKRGERRLRTDANGEAVFKLKLHEDLPEGSLLHVGGVVNPEGMPGAAVDATYSIGRAGYYADYANAAYPRLVEPGKESVFVAQVSDATGKPCAFEGEAYFYERRWVEVWLDPEGRRVSGTGLVNARVVRDLDLEEAMEDPRELISFEAWEDMGMAKPAYAMPRGWTKLFADYVSVLLAEGLPVDCNTNGRLEVRFTPPHEGIYEMRIEKNGRELGPKTEWWRAHEKQSKAYSSWMNFDRRMIFVAADESTESLAFKPGDAFVLGLDKYRAGEPLRCVVVLPEGCRDAFLSLTGEQRTVSQRLAQSNRVGGVTLADTPASGGLVRASLFDIGRGSVMGSVTLSVEDENRHLAVEIAANKTETKPGAPAMLAINAHDFSGKALRAEIAITVADNAVIEMAESHGIKMTEPSFLKYEEVGSSNWRSDARWREITKSHDRRKGAALIVACGGDVGAAGIMPAVVVSESREGGAMAMMEMRAGASFKRQWNTGKTEIGRVFALEDAAVPGFRLRRHFASTAFWEPELVTGADGRASVSFTYPDNLTQWRVAAYAVGEDGNTFGTAQVMTRTSLPLQARVLAPRFLIEGDEATLPGLFVNRTDTDLSVSASMTGEGALDLASAQREVGVPKQAEARASWRAKAREPGEALITLAAKTGAESDGMVAKIPVLEDGIRQDTAAGARLAAGDARASMTLALPDPLNRARLEAEVVITQGRAAVMLDALPYLIDYPYGCVEQTVSRFLPAVVVKKTLGDFGLDAGALEKRILAGETHAAKKRRERTAGLRKLDDVVAQSLGRLREGMRYGQGYGWWPGSPEPDLWMTAYVAWGLQLAAESRVEISNNWLKSLRKILVESSSTAGTVDDRLAWALFVMAETPSSKIEPKDFDALKKTYARVYAEREKLSASGRACLLAASARWGADAERAVLLRNLENGMRRTAHGAHWGATSGYRRATEGAVEATALTALALMKVDPDNALLEPALDWLVMNRRGNGWQNTRASALAVLALARNVAKSGDESLDGSVDVFLNGKKLRGVMFSKANLTSGSARVRLTPELLRGGENRIEIRRVSGRGTVNATALASAWARGDSVKPAANLVSVARDFSGRRIAPTLGGDGKLRSTAMIETGVAQAGDEVTARVTLSVPDTLEYVMIAVPKPAGCEPLNPLSGWDAELVRVDPASDSANVARRRIYREEHDDHSAFFLDHVEAGEWEIRFAMRAVTPGDFRALPVKVEAMYVPEIRANSDARRVRIEAVE